jgi:S-formylglutathione hydrolase FrmB
LHPELYAAAASFSGVLSLAIMNAIPDGDPRRDEFALLLGDLEKIAGGIHDPAAWLQRAAQAPALLPPLYIYTGRQEDIYPLSGMFHAACQSLGVTSEYYEEDGKHDWFLWDRHIRLFLASILGPIPAT